MKNLTEYNEKVRDAVKWIIADNNYSHGEREELRKLAEDQNIPFDELDALVVDILEKKCPSCNCIVNKRGIQCERCGYIFNDKYRKVFKWGELATPIIHILGIIGIIIAVIHLNEIARVSNDTKGIAKRTDTLSANINKMLKEMKTTHLNDFPFNIKGINEIISQAQYSLEIVVDVPAYGIFSNPDTAMQYEANILNRIASKPDFFFQMIIYNNALRKNKLYQQFQLIDNGDTGSTKVFTNFISDKANLDFKRKFDRYVSFFNDTLLRNAPTFGKLWRSIDDRHSKFIHQLSALRPNCIHEVSCELTTYFWIADHSQIAFSFVSLGSHMSECTFKSTDEQLLYTMDKAFKDLQTEK